MKPRVLVFVTGTGTEVGKTWLSACLLGVWKEDGLRVAARKPVQSLDPCSSSVGDADLIACVTGEESSTVCPEHRRYPLSMAPPIAADALGSSRIAVADLARECVWPAGADVGLVEGAGGACSPIAHDGDCLDLARGLSADVLVAVCDAGLGAIHSLRSTMAAAHARISMARPEIGEGWNPLLIGYLNRFDENDPVHATNCDWLAGREDYEIFKSYFELARRLAPACS